MTTDRSTGSYMKDPRLDKIVSWVLATTAVVVMSVCGYFVRDLTGTVESLGLVLSDLKVEVAVMRVDRKSIDEIKAEQLSLRSRLRDLEKLR